MAERSPARISFDLTSIRLFIATAETGSITRAAERICLAPAAVSRRLKELEAQFGLPLFQRLPHGMALTDAGRALLGHARSMTHSVARMQDDAQAFREGDKGVVRIAACTSVVLQFLPADFQRCHLAYPDVKLDLQELNSPGVIQSISRGLVDIGIYESSLGAISFPSMPYHEDRLVLVVPKSHPLARRKCVRLADILAYDVIGLAEGSAISSTLARVATEANLSIRMRILVSSFASMMAMIEQNIGIGLMPDAVAESFAGNRLFSRLRIDDDWAVRAFILCHQPLHSLSSAARGVIELLAHGFANRES
jgi:DNA-binding transcriptional LysR family regulator